MLIIMERFLSNNLKGLSVLSSTDIELHDVIKMVNTSSTAVYTHMSSFRIRSVDVYERGPHDVHMTFYIVSTNNKNTDELDYQFTEDDILLIPYHQQDDGSSIWKKVTFTKHPNLTPSDLSSNIIIANKDIEWVTYKIISIIAFMFKKDELRTGKKLHITFIQR